MSKTIIISSESSNLYTTNRFISEAKKLKLNPIHLNPFQYHLNVKKHDHLINSASHYLFRTTGIRFDDIDLLVAMKFKANGCQIINPLESVIENRNKDMGQLNLRIGKFPILDSLIFRGVVTDDIHKEIKLLSRNEQFILKMNRGNQGIGVQLINGMDSLLSILETYHALKDQKFLLQAYTPHRKEFRILLTQNKLLAVVEKIKTKNDFRGNAKRAKTKIVKNVDSHLIDLSQRILQHLNFEYAGIDIVVTDEGYKILEVNSIPGFESIEQLSKQNIAKELLLDLLK